MRDITEKWSSDRKRALSVTSQTLVGIGSSEFPLRHGNCFSMVCDDGSEYRIVNFYVENLKELEKGGVIEDGVMIMPISGRHAIIMDERIPNNWYSGEYCTTCTPFDLLPDTQKMGSILSELKGETTHSGSVISYDNDRIRENEKSFREKMGIPEPPRKDPVDWIINEEVGIVAVNTNILENMEGDE